MITRSQEPVSLYRLLTYAWTIRNQEDPKTEKSKRPDARIVKMRSLVTLLPCVPLKLFQMVGVKKVMMVCATLQLFYDFENC